MIKLLLIKSNSVLLTTQEGRTYYKTITVDEKTELENLVTSTDDDLEQIVINWITSTIEVNRERNEYLEVAKAIAATHAEDVELKDDGLYMRGVDAPMPKDMLNAIGKMGDMEALKNFWMWVQRNPDPIVRRDLFPFLTRYRFTLTKEGFFFAYRNAKIKSAGIDKEFFKFVSESWLKVKKQKQSPKNYSVTREGDKFYLGEVARGEGNLDALYTQKSGSPTYTDSYSGAFRIEIGEPVTIPREMCDPDPNVTCSRGLHVGAYEWLNQQGTDYFGSVRLVVLVNPKDVVAVPHLDSYGKMRLCCYLPIALAPVDDNGQVMGMNPNDVVDMSEHAHKLMQHSLTELSKLLSEHSDKQFALTLADLNDAVIFDKLCKAEDKIWDYIKNSVTYAEEEDFDEFDEADYEEDEYYN